MIAIVVVVAMNEVEDRPSPTRDSLLVLLLIEENFKKYKERDWSVETRTELVSVMPLL